MVILLDKHPSLLHSVPKIFGRENHAYSYHHLKENFSSFFNKYTIRGNKRKENAMQWLDKAYAQLETNYNAHLNELHMYNDSLAT